MYSIINGEPNKKIGFISGASSGIGAEFVRQIGCSKDCDILYLIARRTENMQKLVQECRQIEEKKGNVFTQCEFISLDLSKNDGIESLNKTIEEIIRTCPNTEIEWLVNAAGFGKFGSWKDVGIDNSMSMIDLNCKAVVSITQMCLPYMSKGGKIIEIASTASFFPLPYMNVYSASKSFVLHYGRALRRELRDKKLRDKDIKLTIVTPGPVRTSFWEIGNQTYSLKNLSRSDAFWMVEADRVVRRAIKDVRKNKAVSTYGKWNKLHKISSKLIPWELMMKIWEKIK